MQLYPPARTLSGSSLFRTYDPATITSVLDALVPSNMLLLVASRAFEGKTDRVEPWYTRMRTQRRSFEAL